METIKALKNIETYQKTLSFNQIYATVQTIDDAYQKGEISTKQIQAVAPKFSEIKQNITNSPFLRENEIEAKIKTITERLNYLEALS